jgi:hypothetical protein
LSRVQYVVSGSSFIVNEAAGTLFLDYAGDLFKGVKVNIDPIPLPPVSILSGSNEKIALA